MLFFPFGRKKHGAGELVDALIASHGRTRKLVQLAVTMTEGSAVPLAEVSIGCALIGRYFTNTFPLHVMDEEASILPRLRGRSASLDAALVRMHERHELHAAMITRFCDHTAALRIDPRDPGARLAVASVARPLGAVLEDHLGAEEQIVFPVIRETFSARECRIIRGEFEARRRGANEVM